MAQPELVKDIEARVKKSGDTMTGSLTVNHSWPTINLLDLNNSKAIFQVNPDANNVYLGMSNSGIIVGPSDLKYLDSNSVYQNIYHTGYKPNFEDVNAISNRWEDRYYIPSGSDLNVYFSSHGKYGGYCIASGNAVNNPSTDTTWWWYFKLPIGEFASNLSTPNKLWWRWHINENYGPWNELLHSNNYNSYPPAKLATARTISLTGDVTGSGTFDGSANLSITTTVVDNSHSHNAYLQRGDNIPAGSSVNNATTSRSYWVASTAIDQPISGNMWGGLIDFNTGSHHQLFFAYTGNNSLVQSYVRANVNGVWQPWSKIWQEGNSVTGAVWNDYAECREADTIEPGYVLVETGDDSLTKSTERLSPFAGVSSDTWGFSQGETDKAKTPIAVAGRVLVYPWQDRDNYKPGDCVCAAPEGKVDIMTREEIIQYPDRIVGTVSSVPTYDKWGGGEKADREPVDVDGRIWIKVR